MNSVTPFMRTIHIYTAMPVLLLMVFFAVTGFLLNHPDWEGSAESEQLVLRPPAWTADVDDWPVSYLSHGLRLLHWLDQEHGIRGMQFELEWDDYDQLLVMSLDGPAANRVVEFFTEEGEIHIDTRQLDTLATLNNLHRAKHTGAVWLWISDISAVAMLLFCLSGLWLACVNRLNRLSSLGWMSLGSTLFVIAVYLMH